MKSVGGGGGGKRGDGHANSVLDLGGPSKFHIGFGGGHVNSAYVEKACDATFPNHYLFIKDNLIR